MANVIPGRPWEGQEYNEELSPRITRGLGAQIGFQAAEAATHPGLYQSRSDDINSPQRTMRPAPIVPPAERAKWLRIIG